MNKTLFLLIPLIAFGCEPGPKSPHGFRLPDGDVAAGQVAFEELQCHRCHTVMGTELAPLEEERTLDVQLGGKVLRVRSYGELVTALVLPSHEVAKGYAPEVVAPGGVSLMADSNETMTVQQLIEMVAFLQSRYEKYLPEDYEPYFPGGK